MKPKKTKKPKKHKVVEVLWDDASFWGGENRTGDEWAKDERFQITTCGYLVAETSKTLIVSQDSDDMCSQRRFRHVTYIPKAMVVSKRVLRR